MVNIDSNSPSSKIVRTRNNHRDVPAVVPVVATRDDAFEALYDIASNKFGPMTHLNKNLSRDAEGNLVRFVVSKSYRGDNQRGFIAVTPKHFTAKWLLISIRDTENRWLIPMEFLVEYLETCPVYDRKAGRKWDPFFGQRDGREVLWVPSQANIDISKFRI